MLIANHTRGRFRAMIGAGFTVFSGSGGILGFLLEG